MLQLDLVLRCHLTSRPFRPDYDVRLPLLAPGTLEVAVLLMKRADVAGIRCEYRGGLGLGANTTEAMGAMFRGPANAASPGQIFSRGLVIR